MALSGSVDLLCYGSFLEEYCAFLASFASFYTLVKPISDISEVPNILKTCNSRVLYLITSQDIDIDLSTLPDKADRTIVVDGTGENDEVDSGEGDSGEGKLLSKDANAFHKRIKKILRSRNILATVAKEFHSKKPEE
jgi:hypothetical protein